MRIVRSSTVTPSPGSSLVAATQNTGNTAWHRSTRRGRFLTEMDAALPWEELLRAIEPAWNSVARDFAPASLSQMLRIHLLQFWFRLTESAVEDELHDTASLRRFAGIDTVEAIPDEATILKFRALLKQRRLVPVLRACINRRFRERGLSVRNGAIVDAAILIAPISSFVAEPALVTGQEHTGDTGIRSNS